MRCHTKDKDTNRLSKMLLQLSIAARPCIHVTYLGPWVVPLRPSRWPAAEGGLAPRIRACTEPHDIACTAVKGTPKTVPCRVPLAGQFPSGTKARASNLSTKSFNLTFCCWPDSCSGLTVQLVRHGQARSVYVGPGALISAFPG